MAICNLDSDFMNFLLSKSNVCILSSDGGTTVLIHDSLIYFHNSDPSTAKPNETTTAKPGS